MTHQKSELGDFPGGQMVKTLPSSAGCVGSISSWGVSIPRASWPKKKKKKKLNRSNISKKSIKTLKMVDIKKIFFKKSKVLNRKTIDKASLFWSHQHQQLHLKFHGFISLTLPSQTEWALTIILS